MRAKLVICSVLGAMAACGRTPAAPPDSGVRGRVVAGPQCPVEIQGSPCPDAPIAAELRFTGGAGVTAARSGADGRFEVRLAPGRYQVTGEPVSGAMFCKPAEVVVAAGRYTELTFACDTGIR